MRCTTQLRVLARHDAHRASFQQDMVKQFFEDVLYADSVLQKFDDFLMDNALRLRRPVKLGFKEEYEN